MNTLDVRTALALLTASCVAVVVFTLIILGVVYLIHQDHVGCPPLIEEAGGLRLFFGADADMEVSELDLEFAEACDLKWKAPVHVPRSPSEEGGQT